LVNQSKYFFILDVSFKKTQGNLEMEKENAKKDGFLSKPSLQI